MAIFRPHRIAQEHGRIPNEAIVISAFPVPLQQTFERRVKIAESSQSQQAKALDKAAATFDAILPRTFA